MHLSTFRALLCFILSFSATQFRCYSLYFSCNTFSFYDSLSLSLSFFCMYFLPSFYPRQIFFLRIYFPIFLCALSVNLSVPYIFHLLFYLLPNISLHFLPFPHLSSYHLLSLSFYLHEFPASVLLASLRLPCTLSLEGSAGP